MSEPLHLYALSRGLYPFLLKWLFSFIQVSAQVITLQQDFPDFPVQYCTTLPIQSHFILFHFLSDTWFYVKLSTHLLVLSVYLDTLAVC